jgi:hypothetical protein
MNTTNMKQTTAQNDKKFNAFENVLVTYNLRLNYDDTPLSISEIPCFGTPEELIHFINLRHPKANGTAHDDRAIYCFSLVPAIFKRITNLKETLVKNVMPEREQKRTKARIKMYENTIKKLEHFINRITPINNYWYYFHIGWRILYVRHYSRVKYFNKGTFKTFCKNFNLDPSRIEKYSMLALHIEYSTFWKSYLIDKEVEPNKLTEKQFWLQYTNIVGRDFDG